MTISKTEQILVKGSVKRAALLLFSSTILGGAWSGGAQAQSVPRGCVRTRRCGCNADRWSG